MTTPARHWNIAEVQAAFEAADLNVLVTDWLPAELLPKGLYESRPAGAHAFVDAPYSWIGQVGTDDPMCCYLRQRRGAPLLGLFSGEPWAIEAMADALGAPLDGVFPSEIALPASACAPFSAYLFEVAPDRVTPRPDYDRRVGDKRIVTYAEVWAEGEREWTYYHVLMWPEGQPDEAVYLRDVERLDPDGTVTLVTDENASYFTELAGCGGEEGEVDRDC